ncbi:hypothetical protein BEWA_010910 [Theileria equi strain WA]|uniref:Uncharacterized protein n=1 Tax=Theileria equi strain WA TaxID=1537102 RepID=L0B3H8_THEEQ|nr:hypothetical protein BEWA_010910 [Theileria equi strain WA]AFZ81674.1 hypothetical protein BEWA_010910 [Theileria equi strain WA]|eukprot:XP_004831340.1 hypothetical protein BEWA_010910 [Theileria equi strain WA]
MSDSGSDNYVNVYLKTCQKHDALGNSILTSNSQNDSISHLGKLKNDIASQTDQIETYLSKGNLTSQEWQKVIDLKSRTKHKLEFANNLITELLKRDLANLDKTKNVQIQRLRRIYDQHTREFNNICKQVETGYQSFMLFDSGQNEGTQGSKGVSIVDSGKAIVEAIIDIESLTEQASLNLDMLKKGNKRMGKIYSKLNTMVDKHLFNIHKLQKNIRYVMIKNRSIVSIVIGIFIFIVLYKITNGFF